MSQTKAEKATDKLCELSLEKKQEIANAQAIIHKILNGRYKPEQEKMEQENQKPRGKFFGIPRISPHCETP